jgi:hypothetical protein
MNIEQTFYDVAEVESDMVKREFIVERQGKSFVLYAGLLDLAHSQGLRAIRTHLLQVPSEDNGQTAIVSAEVETDRGTYSGLGDASPSNVARAMLNCTIRLAETRAKARALRDAVNVGVAAFEELGELDESTAVTPIEAKGELRVVAPVSVNGAGSSNGDDSALVSAARSSTQSPMTATPAQVRAIYSIARDQHSLSEQDVDDRSQSLFGAAPADLSRKQASEFITTLKGSR